MKTLTLVLTSTLLASTAFAADLPVRKAAPVPTWAGFYVGLNGGMNLGSFNPVFGVDEKATEADLSDNNWLAGGHMGYLVQTGSLVLGPEVGIQYWGLKKEGANAEEVLLQQKIDWSAYTGVRVGLAFNEYLMPYVGGGIAWAHIKGEMSEIPGSTVTSSLTGWYVAGGLDLRIAKDVIFGAEYRHIDFGDVVPALKLPSDRMTVDQITGRLSLRLN